MNNNNKTFRLVLLGMLTAIIIIQTSIPFLGYIPIGPLSLTIIQVTVIIAAIVLGTKEGAIIGGIWGMITFIRNFCRPDKRNSTNCIHESACVRLAPNFNWCSCCICVPQNA
ncbi:ECF transporter S component [Metabacillus endolithicus]|uniref:ECF transporter S component n=1 Tax=Metabacillus endolithicus TaxID=1535204 RepID=UPI00248FBB14|nr:ECF transporter S component [Metabacillus endolithicus]